MTCFSHEAGSNPNTRSSCWQRQAFAMRAAHAIASSREGSSSTVKPPLSGGAQGYPPAENVPSAETSTGATSPLSGAEYATPTMDRSCLVSGGFFSKPGTEHSVRKPSSPPALSELSQIFEPWNISVLDVENSRLHYARTLRHWMDLYEGASDKVAEMFDEKFVRMWRLYLAGSIAAFTTGTLQLFQVLFAPGQSNDVPWTRDYIYAR